MNNTSSSTQQVEDFQLRANVTREEQNILNDQPSLSFSSKDYKWWFTVILCIFSTLVGQVVGVLLGRFYFEHGGNSKWMATLAQSGGAFLLVIPYFLLPARQTPSAPILSSSTSKVAPAYIGIGLLVSGSNLMYSYGLLLLPVSTYSLVCASQLAFNAIFSYILNSLKLTALIINSVILLTLSAALLGFHADSGNSSSTSNGKHALGFILTLGASATYSLILSLVQLTFERVLKKENLLVVWELLLCTGIVATLASVVGLFASGEWETLSKEMNEFSKGRVSYLMAIIWTAVSWQVFSVGTVGMIFVISSLFSNVVGTVGLPLVPIFAVIFFKDKMDGVKVIAMLMAVWGFLSYVYQHYLDDLKVVKSSRASVL